MSLPSECPLCGAGAEYQRVRTPHVFGGRPEQAFFHCIQCDVNHLFPRLTPEEEHTFYVREFETFMAKRSGEKGGWHTPDHHVRANETQFKRRMVYLEPLLPKGEGRILEVGCSSGFMLHPLKERGFTCVGIEPSGLFADYVRGRGLACHESWETFTTSADGAKRYDLIMHFFVLEHVAEPAAFLARQYELLAPGGHLVVEVPNAADALATLLDLPAFERFYWSVAHHWYFTRRSLEWVLTRVTPHNDILFDQRYDLSNHMSWAMDGRPGGQGRFTALWGKETETAYKQALIRSGHCDTLIGILSNPEFARS